MSVKCSIKDCLNNRSTNPEKYFFCSPSAEARRKQWENVIGKSYGLKSKFMVCEDHFDLRQDYDYYKINGAPFLKTSACPHRNLTKSDMKLQAKIDQINWSCFVPNCENQRLTTNKKLIFFPVPEDGMEAIRWKSAIAIDEGCLNASADNAKEFCCEEHFDIDKDVQKLFRCNNGMVEFKVKAGVVPSLRLSEQKFSIDPKERRLGDSVAHPRMILNNHVSYFYDSKLPLLTKEEEMTNDIEHLSVIKMKPGELAKLGYTLVEIVSDDENCIKTEPVDHGYDGYESNSQLVIKREIVEFQDQVPESEQASDSSSDSSSESSEEYNDDYEEDPDVTSDDFSSESDDSISDELHITSDSESDEELGVGARQKFQCRQCYRLVCDLDEHEARVHLNFAQNINRTICGLCWEKFENLQKLKDHHQEVHDGNRYSCHLCDFMTPVFQNIRKHIITVHSSERPFLCQRCGLTYRDMRDLRRHARVKHTAKRKTYACNRCEKKLLSKFALRSHIQTVHLRQRPFKCTVEGCNKTFGSRNNLKQHEIVHNDQKQLYPCIICEKKFSIKWNLRAHIKNVHKA